MAPSPTTAKSTRLLIDDAASAQYRFTAQLWRNNEHRRKGRPASEAKLILI